MPEDPQARQQLADLRTRLQTLEVLVRQLQAEVKSLGGFA